MLRWSLIATLALAATQAQAVVRLDGSFAVFSNARDGDGEFEPGLGTSSRSVRISDIGGCEGADITGERCGAYESSGFSLVLTDNGFDYAASLTQNHAIAFTTLSTGIYVAAWFRADREMRFSPREVRNNISLPLCDGNCTNALWSNISQSEQQDGSWLLTVEAATSASTSGGIQSVGHLLSLTASEVPEPASWALMIAGFGLIGAVQRRQPQRRGVIA